MTNLLYHRFSFSLVHSPHKVVWFFPPLQIAHITSGHPSALDLQVLTLLPTEELDVLPRVHLLGVELMFFTQQGQGGSVVFLPRTRRGKTATKWDEQELLGQNFFSRKQKRRESSVFSCANERQRTQFWLAKSECKEQTI